MQTFKHPQPTLSLLALLTIFLSHIPSTSCYVFKNEIQLSSSESRISAFISDGNDWSATDLNMNPIKCSDCVVYWITGSLRLIHSRAEHPTILYSMLISSNETFTFDFPIIMYREPVGLQRQIVKQDYWQFFNLQRPSINSLRILEISNSSRFD